MTDEVSLVHIVISIKIMWWFYMITFKLTIVLAINTVISASARGTIRKKGKSHSFHGQTFLSKLDEFQPFNKECNPKYILYCRLILMAGMCITKFYAWAQSYIFWYGKIIPRIQQFTKEKLYIPSTAEKGFPPSCSNQELCG